MRLLGHTLTAAAIGALALMVAPACADNDQSIFIRQVVAPGGATKVEGGGCTYQPDPAGAALPQGVVDVALRPNYQPVLLVGNQLIQRGDGIAPRAEPNRVKITGAIVRVTDTSDNTLGEFTSVSQGFVEPGTGNTPGFGLMAVTAIDAPTLSRIAGTINGLGSRLVVAKIRAFGQTLGGVDLESGDFEFPVTVCRGCLISYITGDDPALPDIDCNKGTATGEAQQFDNLPCEFGQDSSIPCELCRGASPPTLCDGPRAAGF